MALALAFQRLRLVRICSGCLCTEALFLCYPYVDGSNPLRRASRRTDSFFSFKVNTQSPCSNGPASPRSQPSYHSLISPSMLKPRELFPHNLNLHVSRGSRIGSRFGWDTVKRLLLRRRSTLFGSGLSLGPSFPLQ
jgi:hypothetical protein